MMYETKHVIFDEDRALEVFTLLCDHWRNQTWLFENIVLPEDQFTEWMDGVSPELKSHWLYISALPQRGGVMAEDPFTPLWALFKTHQGLYRPEEFLKPKKWTVKKITNAIMEVSPSIGKSKSTGEKQAHALGYKLEQHAAAWKHNMTLVANRFDCDVRNLFARFEHLPVEDRFEATFREIDNKVRTDGIIGMRRKIFSLFVIWMQKDGLIENFPCPVPVDFHALRVLLATNIITLKDTKIVQGLDNGTEKHLTALMGQEYKRIQEPIINDIAMWTNEFLFRTGLSHIDLNPALWVLSRELCAAHPQNTAYKDNTLYLFPEDFKGNLKDKKIAVSKSLCGVCPLEHLCDYAVPSKPYYKAGSLIKIPRVKNLPCYHVPQTLFGPRQEVFPFKGKKHARSKQQDRNQDVLNGTDYVDVSENTQRSPIQRNFWDIISD